MRKGLFLILLLGLVIQFKPIKFFLSRLIVDTIYWPLLATYGEYRSLMEVRSENRILREMLAGQIRFCSLIPDSLKMMGVYMVSYAPFGFPGELYFAPAIGKRNELLIWKGKVAGKIAKVGYKFGKAFTFYSHMFRLGVMVNGYSGVLEGGNPPVVKYIPVEYPIKPGDTVFTSGIGAVHIRGIPVGVVKRVEKDRIFPYFHRIEVEPFFEIHKALILNVLSYEADR